MISIIVTNTNLTKEKPVDITIKGTKSMIFRAFRTNGKDEKYEEIGLVKTPGGVLLYVAPPNSVTTFFVVD